MKILAIDSCSNVATAALMEDDVLIAQFSLNNKTTHSTKLLPQIEYMMKNAETEFANIDLFAVTIGPGSFTGERIGVATAKALAHAVNKPMVGVSALKAMAYNFKYTDYLICPIMDARREQVYTATYHWDNDVLLTVNEDRTMALGDLLEEINEDVIFLGDGVPVFKDKIAEKLGKKAHFAPANLLHINGSGVAECAKDEYDNGNACDYSSLVPTYLRLSQAEREYNEKTLGGNV